MAITRWDPMSELRAFTRQMERSFGPLMGSPSRFFAEREPLAYATGEWPTVDVYEDQEEVLFRVEAPGMSQKDIQVQVEDSTLALRGEKTLNRSEKKENYQRLESFSGTFYRAFSLPSTIDRDKVKAEMKNGVLEIHVPKREGAKAKMIPIGS
ncbi:MAG TPA: Hsp20/alpha crystallin family protein [Myxococcales bacterium]|nr:Hsp20/alpha crystallin family protein [Myxococcales bacterium]